MGVNQYFFFFSMSAKIQLEECKRGSIWHVSNVQLWKKYIYASLFANEVSKFNMTHKQPQACVAARSNRVASFVCVVVVGYGGCE